MAFALLRAQSAQGNTVIEKDVVADFRGLADDHAHAVVDEKLPADDRGGVDFDSRQPSRYKGK